MCFEGACFKRSVVQKIGLPDARFFIYWDDALYGYLASKVTQPILIPDFVLSRCREVPGQSIGSVRQLNSTSDMTRYYITRNRGYIARYFQVHGDYNPVLFGVGTALTFAKEINSTHFGRQSALLVWPFSPYKGLEGCTPYL